MCVISLLFICMSGIVFDKGSDYYSYLKASIGSRLAAFFAGYHPKNMPIKTQTLNDNITELPEIDTDTCYDSMLTKAPNP